MFSFKSGGTKQFQCEDQCTFGWQAILALYKQENDRGKLLGWCLIWRRHIVWETPGPRWMSFQLKLCRLEIQKCLINIYIFTVYAHNLFDFCLEYSKNKFLVNSTGIFIRIHHHQMFPVFQKPPSQLFQKGFLSHSKITLMEGKVLKNIDKDMVISQIGCLPSWRKVKCSIFIGFLIISYCIMFTQIQSLFIPQTPREFSFLWQSMKVHASPNLLNIFHGLGSTTHWCTWI